MNKDNGIRVIYLFFMSFTIPLLRYVSLRFDALNNNAVRFLAGGGVFALICLFKFRNTFRIIRKNPVILLKLLAIACLMTGNMYFYMSGLKDTSALTGSVFGILAMPTAVIMAAVFFKDERGKVKQKSFILGSLIALFGSMVFVACGNRSGTNGDFWRGSLYLGIGIFLQSIQNLVVKHVGKTLHSIVISASTALISGMIFLFLSIQTGKVRELMLVPGTDVLWLAFAGIYGLCTGMLLAFYIVQKQGVVVYNVLQLIVPFSTAVVGYLLLGETINWIQGMGALTSVLGCVFALKERRNGKIIRPD